MSNLHYTAEDVELSLKDKYEKYYTALEGSQRAKDLFCLTQWLNDELIEMLKASDLDRRDILANFNRLSRDEDNLYELAAALLNSVLNNKIERYRSK